MQTAPQKGRGAKFVKQSGNCSYTSFTPHPQAYLDWAAPRTGRPQHEAATPGGYL